MLDVTTLIYCHYALQVSHLITEQCQYLITEFSHRRALVGGAEEEKAQQHRRQGAERQRPTRTLGGAKALVGGAEEVRVQQHRRQGARC